MITLQRILLIAIYLRLVAAVADPVLASDDSAAGETEKAEGRRNRIDLTELYLNTSRLDSATGIFGYTRDLSSGFSLSLQTTYLDSDVGGSGGGGFGDSSVALSYVPNISVAQSPWLPKRVGTGVSVVLPTGNAEERRGFDTTIVNPYTGMVYRWREKFLILPPLRTRILLVPL